MLADREAEVFLLNREQFSHYWPDIEEGLDLNHDLWKTWTTKERLVEDILKGGTQIWVASRKDGPIILVLATRVYDTPLGRVLQVPLAFGSGLIEMFPCLDLALDRFGASIGCYRLEVMGRKGFERLCKASGAEFMCSIMTRPIRALRGN